MKPCALRFLARHIVLDIRVATVKLLHTTQNKVNLHGNTLSVSETSNAIDHVRYMHDFSALVRELSLQSKNYCALRHLDFMLDKTPLLDSATSVLVIDGLCRLNKLGRAITVLSNLRKKGNVSDNFLYGMVIYCLAREGRIDGVEAMWNEVCGRNSSLDRTMNCSDFILYICEFSGELEIENVSMRVVMDGWDLSLRCYLALMGALCRKNKCSLAKEILRNMKSNCLEPDDLTYLAMFQCFCGNGFLVEADLILRTLVKTNFSIDICVYGSFLHGLCKMGMFREANKLFDKMLERDSKEGLEGGVRLKEGRRVIFQLNCGGAVPEIMIYETYFRSLCSVGRLDHAEKLLKEMMMKRPVLEVCVYKSFVNSLFRANRAEDALRFFNAQRTKGIVPVEGIAESIIMGLCQIGRVDDAWGIFYEFFISHGFVFASDICNCILSSYWTSGRVSEAESLFEKMQEGDFGGPNVSTYNVMLKGLCDEGNVVKASVMFEEMLKNNMQMNGASYEIIIRGLCQADNLAKAHKFLNKMMEDGLLFSYLRWKLVYDSNFVGSRNGVSLGF